MAARRLVIVMLVLLFVSSLVAALAPVRPVEDEPEPEPPSPAPAVPAPSDPKIVEAQIDADAAEPPTISVTAGDQLRLEVVSRTPGTVELVGLGPTDDVDRFDPALFNLLLSEADSYAVRFLGKKRTLGTIEVSEPTPEPPQPPN